MKQTRREKILESKNKEMRLKEKTKVFLLYLYSLKIQLQANIYFVTRESLAWEEWGELEEVLVIFS